MLRTTNPQHSLWETILPQACLGLPTELAQVDRLLDAPAFLAPLTAHFDPRIGRPSVPLDTYLRMMFLKFRYRLGYELLCREVADSISWQRFCRIPLGGQVPHPTTLVKLTRRLGEQTVTDLNEGVERVAIPRKGQPGAARQATEHTRGFRRLVKWRTGCEGRISHLKHRFGWDRTLMDGIGGARIWCGQGVFAHNLVKISGLLEANQAG
jgi:IS5 family transposase